MRNVEKFDCPKCVPRVPYRRVRAKKVVTAVDAREFGKYQVVIERQLAAKFGEYLLKEGLIRFSTDALSNYNNTMVTVTAHLGVVTPEFVKVAGAPKLYAKAEVQIPKSLEEARARRRQRKEEPGLPAGWYDQNGPARVEYPTDGKGEEDFAEPWTPQVFSSTAPAKPPTKRELLRQQREEREGMKDRFSGLELDEDE